MICCSLIKKRYNLINVFFVVLGNTSNLNCHLKSKHSNVLSEKVSTSVRLMEEECQETVDDPKPKVSTSIVNISENSDNICKDNANNVTQETFMNSFKRQKTIGESFALMSSYQEGGQKSEKIIHSLMYIVCKDNQPLSIVEDKGFRHLMHTVSPNFKIPSRRDLSRRIFLLYDSMKEVFINKLKNVQCISLTTDIWTDIQTRSYIGITIHFVDNYVLNSGLLGVYELDERHSSEYIASKLIDVCKEWNISNQSVVAVTTDGAANMIKAVELAFDKKRQIICFAHALNLVAQQAISNVPEIVTLVLKIKNIVKWFKQSVIASDDLRKATKGEGKLLQEVPTRWNSTFYMLERFITLKQIVNDIVHRHISAPDMASAKEIHDISEIIDLLRPLEAATKELCAQKYVTTSMVIPMVSILQKNINEFKPTQQLGFQLKAVILIQCDKRFGSIESCSLLGMATVLDPRFKKIYFKNAVALSNMLKYISDEIKQKQSLSSGESSSDTDTTSMKI